MPPFSLNKATFSNTQLYRVCHGFRITKQNDYLLVTFDHFWSESHFSRQLGLWKNSLEPKPNQHNKFNQVNWTGLVTTKNKLNPKTKISLSKLTIYTWVVIKLTKTSEFDKFLFPNRISINHSRCKRCLRSFVFSRSSEKI